MVTRMRCGQENEVWSGGRGCGDKDEGVVRRTRVW